MKITVIILIIWCINSRQNCDTLKNKNKRKCQVDNFSEDFYEDAFIDY